MVRGIAGVAGSRAWDIIVHRKVRYLAGGRRNYAGVEYGKRMFLTFDFRETATTTCGRSEDQIPGRGSSWVCRRHRPAGGVP